MAVPWGLHSWDISFLLEHDRQWKTMLLVFCLAGFLFSLFGVYLGITAALTANSSVARRFAEEPGRPRSL